MSCLEGLAFGALLGASLRQLWQCLQGRYGLKSSDSMVKVPLASPAMKYMTEPAKHRFKEASPWLWREAFLWP